MRGQPTPALTPPQSIHANVIEPDRVSTLIENRWRLYAQLVKIDRPIETVWLFIFDIPNIHRIILTTSLAQAFPDARYLSPSLTGSPSPGSFVTVLLRLSPTTYWIAMYAQVERTRGRPRHPKERRIANKDSEPK